MRSSARLRVVLNQLDGLSPLHVAREVGARIFRMSRHHLGVLQDKTALNNPACSPNLGYRIK